MVSTSTVTVKPFVDIVATQANSGSPLQPASSPVAITHPKYPGGIIKHIPKSARPSCCSALTDILKSILSNSQNPTTWNSLFHFCPNALTNPPRTGSRMGISATIKERLLKRPTANTTIPVTRVARKKRSDIDLSSAVSSKIEDGNMKAALRLLCSEDKPADFSDAAYASMESRHPSVPSDRRQSADPCDYPSIQVRETEVLSAIKSFPAGSAG